MQFSVIFNWNATNADFVSQNVLQNDISDDHENRVVLWELCSFKL